MKLKTTCAAIATAIATAATSQAVLVHAGGNVTIVGGSFTLASPDGIGAVSDGNSTVTGFGQVYTNDPGGFPSDYFASAGSMIMDLDLGSAMSLDAIAFWNRGGSHNNSVSAFNAVFSTDAIFGNGDDSTAFAFTPASDAGGQQDFALGSIVHNAQYVRITITDNYFNAGNPGGGGDRTAFTEFQFNQVPEPSSTALLGLGGLALILRRRK